MRRVCWCFLTVAVLLISSTQLLAVQEESEQRETKEPVFRVSKLSGPDKKPLERHASAAMSQGGQPAAAPANTVGTEIESNKSVAPLSLPNTNVVPLAPQTPVHQLDRAIEMARQGLGNIQANINDYSAIMVKRERVNGKVSEPSYIQLKVRNRKANAVNPTPFSVYMRFMRPKASAGREVIWVEGANDGNLVAHEGSGLLALKRFNLPPTGALAMRGQRYPIYEAGIEKLIEKLIEKAERDRAVGPCNVEYRPGAKINGRNCTLIEVTHPNRMAPYEFHKAQVFIDDEMQIPVRYAAYDWPTGVPNQPLPLIEEYTYVNVKLNIGLTGEDFSPENPAYKFPRR